MRPSRSLVGGTAAWLLVVAVGSLLVWLVISRAGDGVVSAEAPVPATADPAQPSGASRAPSPGPSTAPDSLDSVRRTWQGPGGQLTVECRGDAAGLITAIPESGYAVEVDDRGPARVRVEFETDSSGDGGGSRSRVEATCVEGAPRFAGDLD